MMITKDNNGNLTYSGVDQDIIEELFHRLNWTYVYPFIKCYVIYYNQLMQHLSFSYSYVNVVNEGGLVKSLIQQVVNNEVDISTYGFGATLERVELMDFSISIQLDHYRFLLRYPDAKSRLLGPVRPFQPTVTFVSVKLKYY
jgi:hypothetical protein